MSFSSFQDCLFITTAHKRFRQKIETINSPEFQILLIYLKTMFNYTDKIIHL